MATCNYCDEPIKFRHVGGQVTPIHLNGGWCSGNREQRLPDRVTAGSHKPYLSSDTFVNPNAKCPVCKQAVFYYENEHGSKVFFDHLGPPWPKHFCTDNHKAQSQSKKISQPISQSLNRKGRKWSKGWQPFLISQIIEHSEHKRPYYTLAGSKNHKRFSIVLAPEKPVKFSEKTHFFVKSCEGSYEISTIIELPSKKLVEYSAIGYRDLETAAKSRHGAPVEKPQKKPKLPPSISADKVTVFSPKSLKFTMTACDKCKKSVPSFSEPVGDGSFRKMQFDKLNPPWLLHKCNRPKTKNKRNGWSKVKILRIIEIDGVKVLNVLINKRNKFWVYLDLRECPPNFDRPIFIRQYHSNDRCTLSTIQLKKGKKLKRYYLQGIFAKRQLHKVPQEM